VFASVKKTSSQYSREMIQNSKQSLTHDHFKAT